MKNIIKIIPPKAGQTEKCRGRRKQHEAVHAKHYITKKGAENEFLNSFRF